MWVKTDHEGWPYSCFSSLGLLYNLLVSSIFFSLILIIQMCLSITQPIDWYLFQSVYVVVTNLQWTYSFANAEFKTLVSSTSYLQVNGPKAPI